MNIEQRIKIALETKHLVLVVFYTDGPPRYEWIDTILRDYEKRIVELVKINIEKDKTIAESHNIRTAPAFLLLHGGHELWRQVGELAVNELKDVLEDFR